MPIDDLNLGEVKGGAVHLDAATVMRLKQYRIRQLQSNPGTPLPGVPQLVRWAVNEWLNTQEAKA
ncbi:MAG: hypothetical protein RR903_02600 [Edwardsiella sp. (in: enterobacteria)]|uniref:hypothetical protein n=1 Tax=Edwardsiella piscicida TaxID=1263550 RepID=UPI00370D2EE1